MKYFIYILAALFLSTFNSFSQSADSLIKVTDGVYMLTGHVGNISFLVTDSGVLVIDSGDKPENGKRIAECVAQVTPKPIVYTILTHYHFDHVGGLATLPANIDILSHTNTKINIQNREKENVELMKKSLLATDSLKNVLASLTEKTKEYCQTDILLKAAQKSYEEAATAKFMYPTETTNGDFKFVLGKDTIWAMYKGIGHTNGDLAVWFKNRGVMVMGDLLFNHAFPYVDPIGDANNWAKQLKDYASMNLPYYIPGHMYQAKASDLMEMAKYLEDLSSVITKLKNEGKSLDEIKKLASISYTSSYEFQFFKEQNIEAVYNQLFKKQ